MSVKLYRRGPGDDEYPYTLGYARQSPVLRGRSLVPEVPLGDGIIRGGKEYPGLGVKYADLAGVRPVPTLIETKTRFNARTLYNAIGEAIVKRQLLATEYHRAPAEVDARIVFGDAEFPVEGDLPPLAGVIAAALKRAGIRWVVGQGDHGYEEVTSL
jgi:hypothetical protein